MTALMTRNPLQPLENPHVMSELGEKGRRTSARLAGRDDTQCLRGTIIEGRSISSTIEKSKANFNGGAAKSSSKRKIAYDEEDDGFAFKRTRSKKAKILSVEQQPKQQEEQQQPQFTSQETKTNNSAKTKKPRKKSFGSPASSQPSAEPRREKKGSIRKSTPATDIDPPPLSIKKRRKPRESTETEKASNEQLPDIIPQSVDKEQALQEHHGPETTFDTTKIALPFADTPIIRRNKEMRKGAQSDSRRSSLSLRGRRASSLINTGKSNALPHDGVESSEFYKHIESEGLSEPRRMQQLLMWCGARALGDKPPFTSGDGNSRLAAREIQSQLLRDFSTKSGLSDWFDRKETTPPVTVPKPNPKNLSNLAKIEELESQILRLQAESQTWQSLLRPPPEHSLQLPPLPVEMKPQQINPDTLSGPGQRAALSLISSASSHSTSSLAKVASTRLRNINQGLEFEVDRFGNNVHAIRMYKEVADRVAGEMLGMCSKALQERDVEGIHLSTQKAGGEPTTRDVLRTLSRTIDR